MNGPALTWDVVLGLALVGSFVAQTCTKRRSTSPLDSTYSLFFRRVRVSYTIPTPIKSSLTSHGVDTCEVRG